MLLQRHQGTEREHSCSTLTRVELPLHEQNAFVDQNVVIAMPYFSINVDYEMTTQTGHETIFDSFAIITPTSMTTHSVGHIQNNIMAKGAVILRDMLGRSRPAAVHVHASLRSVHCTEE